MAPFKSSFKSLLSSLDLPLFLLDIGLDICVAVGFYREASYVRLGVLLLLLIGSSVLAQLFSWFWYKYEKFEMHTGVEKRLKRHMRKLHVFQLGLCVRHIGVFETSVKKLCTCSTCSCSTCSSASSHTKDYMFQKFNLAMLRIIEAFSESAPQIVLMLTVILQKGQKDYFSVLKIIFSVLAVTHCIFTPYVSHMRSVQPGRKQNIVLSVIFFICILFLVVPRLVALSLFASVLPCFIVTHFFCSWLVLLFFARSSKVDIMDCRCGEWLYRATVGLIWYFDWFSVVEGKTRNKKLLYHSYILADISILCGVWAWKMSTDPPPPPFHEISQHHAIITAASVVGVYFLGLLFKIIYYTFFHPNVQKDKLKGGNKEEVRKSDEVDCYALVKVEMDSPEPTMMMRSASKGNTNDVTVRCNKRMRMLAENFYS
ncbi:XK-related protein 8 [Kryptolebias marmoratus]|uniref:XK-related protein 8 n=1 Tax=Kryptolebias marmoratus TaxID=37003 RepID=UPI000D5302A7|nr:XK-related protein 8 [Kryptolebias marmoratus]